MNESDAMECMYDHTNHLWGHNHQAYMGHWAAADHCRSEIFGRIKKRNKLREIPMRERVIVELKHTSSPFIPPLPRHRPRMRHVSLPLCVAQRPSSHFSYKRQVASPYASLLCVTHSCDTTRKFLSGRCSHPATTVTSLLMPHQIAWRLTYPPYAPFMKSQRATNSLNFGQTGSFICEIWNRIWWPVPASFATSLSVV